MTKRASSVSDLSVGQWVFKWHDTGAFGSSPIYLRVARVTPKTVTLVDECGQVMIRTGAWIHLYEILDDSDVRNVIDEMRRLGYLDKHEVKYKDIVK